MDIGPGWYEDPRKRHEHRYWNGEEWTEHVSDNGQPGVDSLATEPPPVPQLKQAPEPKQLEAPPGAEAGAFYRALGKTSEELHHKEEVNEDFESRLAEEALERQRLSDRAEQLRSKDYVEPPEAPSFGVEPSTPLPSKIQKSSSGPKTSPSLPGSLSPKLIGSVLAGLALVAVLVLVVVPQFFGGEDSPREAASKFFVALVSGDGETACPLMTENGENSLMVGAEQMFERPGPYNCEDVVEKLSGVFSLTGLDEDLARQVIEEARVKIEGDQATVSFESASTKIEGQDANLDIAAFIMVNDSGWKYDREIEETDANRPSLKDE